MGQLNFYIALYFSSPYLCFKFIKGGFINIFYDSSKKFAVCSNIKCNLIFNCETEIDGGDDNLLCPNCKAKLQTHHIVQCQHCEAIVDFIEAEPSEIPIVFSADKCPHCSEQKTTVSKLTALYFPDAYM